MITLDNHTPRELVLGQLEHRETTPVPYDFFNQNFGDLGERLDDYYGGTGWREQLVPFIVGVKALDSKQQKPLGDGRSIDGCGTVWRTDLRPSYVEKPALTEASLKGYDFPEPDTFFDPDMLEAGRRTLEAATNSFRYAHIGMGMFERSWILRGFENALTDLMTEPGFYNDLLDRIERLLTGFAEYAAELPCDAVMLGDDWGEQRGVIMGPERWRKVFKPRYARLYETIHKRGKFVIQHCCGNITDIMPDLVDIGLDVLQSVQPEAMDIDTLKRRWGRHITLYGGLGSQSTLPFGTPEDIRREIAHLVRDIGAGGGYILACAKTFQPETPLENAVAVIESFTKQDRL